jgi:hypothetical protein
VLVKVSPGPLDLDRSFLSFSLLFALPNFAACQKIDRGKARKQNKDP